MNAKRTSLERGLTSAFALVVLVVIAIIPVAMYAMNGITQQAQVLHDTIIKGELAYVKVASDADTLRASSIDAATNPDPLKAAGALDKAKTMIAQFPEDARKMGDLTAKDDTVRPLVEKFVGKKAADGTVSGGSASAYDFQALAAVGLLAQGKKGDALKQIQGMASSAYELQAQDGEALLNALKVSSDARVQALFQARTFALTILIVGALVASLIDERGPGPLPRRVRGDGAGRLDRSRRLGRARPSGPPRRSRRPARRPARADHLDDSKRGAGGPRSQFAHQ
jgi:hypothetical protein